jgi:apolipoprotein N-acyltransferase
LLKRLALALASPFLLGLYAWFPSLIVVPYIALVPWILLYTDERGESPSALWYVAGAWAAWMLQHPSVAHFGWFVPPVMAAALFVGWIPFPFLLRRVHARFAWPRALTVPILWVAVEWFRARVTLAHFDLYGLGYSQARVVPLVQIADITGVYGISFLVAAVNGWIADIFVARRLPAGSVERMAARRVLRRSGAAIAASFLVVIAYGLVRLSGATDEPGPRVTLVQPNVEHNERNAIGVHLSQVIFTETRVAPGSTDLIVWPENAVLDNVRRPGAYLPDLGRLAREKGAPLLVGAMGKVPEAPGRMSNTAYLVDGEGTILGEARKQVLFPWSEQVPADDLLRRFVPGVWRFQRALVRAGWGFVPTGLAGRETTVLQLPWNGGLLPIGVLICVENTYAPIPAEAARKGARVLLNITSEREVGGPVQEQLLRISMMRAVENRLPYVRCGNSGISAFIDPEGRLRRVLRGENGGTIRDYGTLTGRALLRGGGPTFYARSRDAFALLCVVATLVLSALSWGRARRAAALGLLLTLLPALSGCGAGLRPGTDPSRAAEALARGRAAIVENEPGHAVSALAEACAETVACRDAIPPLAAALLATRRLEDGAAVFAAIAQAHPELSAEALAQQGLFLDKLGELREAESAYARSAAAGADASTWATLGTLRLRMERPQDALDAYGKAVSLEPGDPQLRYLHARALWLTNSLPDAEREIDDLLAATPGHGAAWAVKGRLREAAGDDAGALAAYQRALAGDPANVEARFMLARRALAAKDVPRAQALLREIWDLDTRGARGGGGEIAR